MDVCKFISRTNVGLQLFDFVYECTSGSKSRRFTIRTTGKGLAQMESRNKFEAWLNRPPTTGGGCFGTGSLVLMADGKKKAIEELNAGDLVAGCTGFPSELAAFPVLERVAAMHPASTLIEYSNGESVVVSRDQPIVTSSGMVRSKNLFMGAEMTFSSNQRSDRVSGITVVNISAKEGDVELHSLDVEGPDYCFIGVTPLGYGGGQAKL